MGINADLALGFMVAPLVGAWIEMFINMISIRIIWVAPLVGAWIEITNYRSKKGELQVAPLVGAWIEIMWITL